MSKSRNNSNQKMEVEQPVKSVLQKLRNKKSEAPSGSLSNLLNEPSEVKKVLEQDD